MKPIFHLYFDVDGVINGDNTEDRVCGCLGIDPLLVSNVKTFISELKKDYEVRIILVSTWRNNWFKEDKDKQDEFANRLDEALAAFDLEIYDRIPNDANRKARGLEVITYMNEHPCDNYFILDDEDYGYNDYPELMNHKVYINGSYGFSKKKMKVALYMLEAQND